MNGLQQLVTPESTSDEVLVDRARQGDVTALEALYRRHVGLVYGLCLRLLGDEARAEELTQDVWVKVWQGIEGFEGRSSFISWLYRVTTNVVLGSERSRGRRETREARYSPQTDRSPPERVLDRLALERAIAGLPPRARAVFVLHDIEGLSHAEIARMLTIAVGTSRAQLFFARQKLRKELAE